MRKAEVPSRHSMRTSVSKASAQFSWRVTPSCRHWVTFQIDARRDLFIEQSGEGEQDDAGTLPEEGGFRSRAAELFENLLLPLTQ